jgi:CcmD family protein
MLTSFPLLLAQASPGDIAFEIGRLQRNYQFLSYGLVAAWVILVVYVLMMTGRQRRLKREIASLRAMLEDKKR